MGSRNNYPDDTYYENYANNTTILGKPLEFKTSASINIKVDYYSPTVYYGYMSGVK